MTTIMFDNKISKRLSQGMNRLHIWHREMHKARQSLTLIWNASTLSTMPSHSWKSPIIGFKPKRKTWKLGSIYNHVSTSGANTTINDLWNWGWTRERR